ncbi:hypothetical protein LYSHEL_15770 [Lysobacter helvus]|uniref:Uncharacterized protein n=2 Tax=Lysobacteraceae TaxID=32033 RepID=A0ABN6FSD0_9GAMM|nr:MULTISPECIES: hypothetical protein [Lysobacter]BCT92553.1 hypothetical protein LYSCAS_15770 [Lysobacter caseinilyticus]BCT95706.1 hypothetical protein LYSHEL_15770 [Lysobacter helvus]
MYSIQHVLWRGVMAVSLLVVGGFGAYSAPANAPAYIACEDTALVANAMQPVAELAAIEVHAHVASFRHVQFDTIVVKGIPPEDA